IRGLPPVALELEVRIVDPLRPGHGGAGGHEALALHDDRLVLLERAGHRLLEGQLVLGRARDAAEGEHDSGRSGQELDFQWMPPWMSVFCRRGSMTEAKASSDRTSSAARAWSSQVVS